MLFILKSGAKLCYYRDREWKCIVSTMESYFIWLSSYFLSLVFGGRQRLLMVSVSPGPARLICNIPAAAITVATKITPRAAGLLTLGT